MSGTCKANTVEGINKALDIVQKNMRREFRSEIAESEKRAVSNAVIQSRAEIARNRRDMEALISRVGNDLSDRIIRSQRELRAEINQQAQQTNQKLVEMDRRHTQALNDLSNNVYDAIEAQGDWMEKEVNRMDNNINILSKNISILGDSLLQLSDDVKTRFNAHQTQLNQLRTELQGLQEERNADENYKRLAAGRALGLLEHVREKNPNLSRFAPQWMQDKVAEKERRLRALRDDPRSCTVSDANDLIDEVLVMQKEAERLEMEWRPVHYAAVLKARALLELMDKYENHKVKSIYDESEEEELKIDYWTHGRYSEVKNRAKELRQTIDQTTDVDCLYKCIEELNELERKAEELAIQAAELGFKSEERVIISNEILNVMVAQGWELKEDPDFVGGETESDWREGTFAILRRPSTGEELSILVTPKEANGNVENKLIFHRNDELVEAPGAFQARMNEIKREMEKSGFKFGPLTEPACGGDNKIPQLQNSESLRKKGAAAQLRATMG